MQDTKPNYTTLIADDDRMIRQIIAKILSGRCTCVEVSEGREIVKVCKEHDPDVIFLDVHMQDVNGLDLIKEIKGFKKNPYIVIITSDSTQGNVKRAIKEGASDFIAKPFDTKTVLEKFYLCPAVIPPKESNLL